MVATALQLLALSFWKRKKPPPPPPPPPSTLYLLVLAAFVAASLYLLYVILRLLPAVLRWAQKVVAVFGRRVVLAIDLDAPGSAEMVLATTRRCLSAGARSVVLAGGRGAPPGGKFDEQYSLLPLASELSKKLDHRVVYLRDCIGAEVEATCTGTTYASLIVLENTRFRGALEVSRTLARLGDVDGDGKPLVTAA